MRAWVDQVNVFQIVSLKTIAGVGAVGLSPLSSSRKVPFLTVSVKKRDLLLKMNKHTFSKPWSK